MSTIRVDNFGPSAGGTTYSARGIAKAWVNFNGTGTIAARDSENVSSLTDIATGVYGINFTNVMADENYASAGIKQNVSTNTDHGLTPSSGQRSASQDVVASIEANAPADSANVHIIYMGDLA